MQPKSKAFAHRKAPRVPFGGDIVAFTRPEARFEGKNLSTGGIQLVGTASLNVGTEIPIQFHIDGEPHPLVAQGVITWVMKSAFFTGGRNAFGVMFKALTPANQKAIQSFIDDQLQ